MRLTYSPELLIVLIGLMPIGGAMASYILFGRYIDFQVILIAFLGSLSFIFSIYWCSFFYGVRGIKSKTAISTGRINYVLVAIFLIALFGTTKLVFGFINDFGFEALYLRPDLFQSNSIVNSYGYLLYLNVFVFALFSITKPKTFGHKIIDYIVFFVSILSLIFAGNKSYFFQAILFYMLLKSKGEIGFAAKFLFFVLLLVVFLFSIYDQYFDLVDSVSIFDRPIAYIFGGWATLQSYISSDSYRSVYIGDHLFYPLIKIFTMGSFSEESLFNFYDINGFHLNQFSIFGSAFIDFWYIGVVAVGVSLGIVEFILRRVRLSKNPGIYDIIYWYYITELFFSFFFANMFSSLYVYTSIFILIAIDAAYRLRSITF